MQRIAIILGVVITILGIVFILTNISGEVDWSAFDFLVAGCLLFVLGLVIDLVWRKIRNPRIRAIALLMLILAFLILWAELAVGIFGSPLAGS